MRDTSGQFFKMQVRGADPLTAGHDDKLCPWCTRYMESLNFNKYKCTECNYIFFIIPISIRVDKQ